MPSSCAAIDPEFDVDDEHEPPIVHAIVPAGTKPPPSLGREAVRTVFELCRLDQLGQRFWRQPPVERTPSLIVRDVGRVRVVRLLPQETLEWQEREVRRRAKQRPPRPPRGAKTRSKKLLDLIGRAYDD